MKLKLILTLFAIVTLQVSKAQNTKPLREPFTLKLAVDGENYYEESIKGSSYFVHNKTLQIYPSEKLYIEVEIKSDTIYSMKVVRTNLNPKKTIEVEFKQFVKDRKSEGMMLNVNNPFDKVLKYKALMYIVGHDKWIRTSIIPIQPRLSGFETWNDIIITLALEDWQLK